ncbi:WD40-repeat-containing domain protein [Zopfochytrium polystomum]|nr:WD40-repeat-containing domain protein [Zopfochytrium polystomum]
MAEPYQLFWGTPITCHSFNKDRSMVAVSPNSKDVHIYKKSPAGFTLAHVLSEHDQLVTSIDWAPESNKIVTCGQDRNAYVWTFDGKQWKPQLVMLRINRAATFVRWSPREDKFAVATGSKLIAIGYFAEENDWYATKHIKKHIRSTVTSLDWHPDNIVLAVGCADMKARVMSAYIKGVDQKASNPVWGDKLPFGHLCGEFGLENGGWVHSVAFSPSGNVLAWTGHDGNVCLAYGPNSPVYTITTTNLPLLTAVFTSEESIVAAGHDCVPYLFNQHGGGAWTLAGKIDKGVAKAQTGNTARDLFTSMDSRGQSARNDTELNSVHQNTITSIRVLERQGAQVRSVSTTAVDGKLVIWRL